MSTPAKHVLLVEDNPDNQVVYRTILEHHQYLVTSAINGEEALEKAVSLKPDLILMDISIPIIDGWTVTRILKADPKTKHIPVIALTAHALPADREKSLDAGCVGYLAKPCTPRQVLAEVQRVLAS